MKTMTKATDQTTTHPIRDQIFPRNEQGNIVLRHVLMESLLKARISPDIESIDALVLDTLKRVLGAVHVQDTLLTEKQTSERWKFLDVIRLRNMRYKGNGPLYIKTGKHKNSRVFYKVSDVEDWIAHHYQLEPFLCPMGKR